MEGGQLYEKYVFCKKRERRWKTMSDLVPMNFWNFPVIPSVWEDITDIDNWLPAFPNYGTLSGLSISEDDKNVYVEAAVPGVDPKAVDVTVHKGVLWIKGEVKEEKKKKKYYRKATSSYSYRMSLPDTVDTTKEPDAVCKNGIMKVTFAKAPAAQPKKIAVKAVGEEEGNGKRK